jgi:hypothetical protein
MSEQVREAARDLAAAAEAWDKTLSAWCDGPERDALRDAVLNAQRLLALPPQPVQITDRARAVVEAWYAKGGPSGFTAAIEALALSLPREPGGGS